VGRGSGFQDEGRTADDDIAARAFAVHIGTHAEAHFRAALRSPLTPSALRDARRSGVPPFEAIATARRLTAFDPKLKYDLRR
jgi:hypothetical protein